VEPSLIVGPELICKKKKTIQRYEREVVVWESQEGAFGCDGANEPRWNGEVALDGGLESEESEDEFCMTEVRLELLGSIN